MKKMHLWMVMDPYLLAVASIDVSSDASSANTYIKFAAVKIQKRKDFYQKEKGSITDIASASALTKTSETSAGTASFAEGSAQGMAQVQYKSDINADPSSMNTIRRTERDSQANISGWIVRNGK